MILLLRLLVVTVFLIALHVDSHAAITFGRADTFQDGTLKGWQHGSAGATGQNAPAIFANAGPMNAGDTAMGFSSLGGGGVASRFVAFNRESTWTGDYISAGVTAIALDVSNTGSTDLALRLAFGGAGGNWVTDAVNVNPGSGWQPVTFDIQASSLVAVGSASSATGTMNAVSILQILSAENTPSAGSIVRGDILAASAFFDNITATSITAIPEPATALFLLGSLAGMTLVRKRR